MSQDDILIRVGKALTEGWSFQDFKFCEREGGRHSVWVSPPNSDKWHGEKVSVRHTDDKDSLNWIGRLLDEAMGAKEEPVITSEALDYEDRLMSRFRNIMEEKMFKLSNVVGIKEVKQAFMETCWETANHENDFSTDC